MENGYKRKTMKILLNTYEIKLNEKEIKVCIPIKSIENVYVYVQEGYDNIIYGDGIGLQQLFLCTAYMYYQKDSLMYIPLVPKKVLDIHESWIGEPNQYQSLIQGHHTIHLNIKDWKTIKETLRYKKEKREVFEMAYDKNIYESITKEMIKKAYYREFKDFLDCTSGYKNLFLIGSSKSFGALAGSLWSLIKDEESNRKELAQYGIPHVHLDWLMRRKGVNLCIGFYE